MQKLHNSSKSRRPQPVNSGTACINMRFLLAVAILLTYIPVSPPTIAAVPLRPTVAAAPEETPTPSPTATPTPDPVLEQAKREAQIADELKKKAVADKDRAAAEADELKARALPFGTPSNVQIPTGNVQTDAAGWVESQMLAQEAAKQISIRLTGQLCGGRLMPGSILPNPTPTASPAVPTPTPPPPGRIETLVIYNNNDLSGVELYNTVLGQLKQLKLEFIKVNADAVDLLDKTDPTAAPTPTPSSTTTASSPILGVAAAPGIASGLIKSVAELINLFRTETRFENKSVQISEDMVVSHIVEELTGRTTSAGCGSSVKIYYPALYPPMLVKSSDTSEVVKLLNEVERLKNEAALHVEHIDNRLKLLNSLKGKIEDLDKKGKAKAAKGGEVAKKKEELKKHKKGSPEYKKIKADIADLEKEIHDLEKAIAELNAALDPATVMVHAKNNDNFKPWIADLETQKSKMQALINSTDLLSSRLNTPDANTKLTALAQLLRAEKLNGILNDPHTFTLRVAATANGTTKIKKNLFVDAKVRHSAGANLVYQLFNRDGALAQGDVMQCYIDYRSARDVRDVVSGAATVECRSATRPPAGPAAAAFDGNK